MATGRLNSSKKSSIRSDEESCYRFFGLYRTKFARKSSGRASHELHDRNREVDCKENGLNSGPNNKRKLSPVVWDGIEKQVRISSKSRVRSTSSVRSDNTRSSSLESVKDVTSVESCSVFGESDLQISSVESLVSNVSDYLGARSIEGCDQESENEDGEYVQEPNLLKSKWALNDSPGIEFNDNNSSPESGEFKQECFERSGEVSSLSSEDSGYVEDKGYSSFESDDDRLPNGLGVIPSCKNVHEFKRLGKISEGTYGVVHKARDLKTGDIVALKKVKMEKEKEGFPVTALREINILGMLRHPSLVEMKEVVMDDFNGVYMVMECVDHELKGYMDHVKQLFSQSEVKRLMIQLLEGVSYLHDNYVMHRDLKTSNLLLNKNGELKICDFGMSRQYATPLKPYTSLVVTLWYRAPELLLGMQNYTTAVDMWSVGCIMVELLSKKPLFDGGRELEQIDKIFRTLGTPNDLIWPGYSKLPGVKSNFVKQPCNCLRKKFPVATFTGSPALTELGFDLLSKFLTYDPEKRIRAEDALRCCLFFRGKMSEDFWSTSANIFGRRGGPKLCSLQQEDCLFFNVCRLLKLSNNN